MNRANRPGIIRRAVRGMGDVPAELKQRYESGGYAAGTKKASSTLGWFAVILAGAAVLMAGSRMRRNR